MNKVHPESKPIEMTENHNDVSKVIEKKKKNGLLYAIDDVPPWYLSVFLGFQHYLTMVGATLAIPFLITPALCMEDDDPSKGYIISTIFFVSGIVTLLQSTFGCRLPIIQGGTFSFFVPTFAILSLPKFQCPNGFDRSTNTWIDSSLSIENKTEEWQIRMREIQGAICVSAIFQVVMGFTGLMGLLLRFITPLTITPSVAMIGIALFEPASNFASSHWGISIGTILTMTLFSQYLRDTSIPVCLYRKDSGFVKSTLEVFKLFPVLLTILSMWGLSAILTSIALTVDPSNRYANETFGNETSWSDIWLNNTKARTDTNLPLLERSVWFRFPYPFQWGIPTVSAAGVFGMFAGVLASAIESVGDYYACARLSGAPPPPIHAVNRGIGIEGIGCIIAGMWGTGNGTTSYSENIGAIGVTKVGSRRVVQYGGLIMIMLGLFSKFGAVFTLIPTPIVGGIFFVMFGMITAVGLSNLQFVDLNSSRNLFILGFSLFFGLAFPQWMESSQFEVNTSSHEFNQVITVLLKTSMFLAGFIGCFLDNTIPGTDEERGLIKWNDQFKSESSENEDSDVTNDTYGMPFGMGIIKRAKWLRSAPFSPTFSGFTCTKPNGNHSA